MDRLRVELDVIADEKIEVAVAVVVEKVHARAPAHRFAGQDPAFRVTSVNVPSPLLRNKNVVPPETAK